MSRADTLAGQALEALLESVDRARFGRALETLAPSASTSPSAASASAAAGAPTKTAASVLHRIVLSYILDDAILGARPGDAVFPLRVFFGELGEAIGEDTAFALASGLSFYFRVPMEEESKMRVGLEVSRLYYRFAEERGLSRDTVVALSPLLARLMSTEMERLRFESVDGAGMFDSSVHERAAGSDPSGARLFGPRSFLCRVVSSSMVRVKALVRT